jgi:hypothetical protein
MNFNPFQESTYKFDNKYLFPPDGMSAVGTSGGSRRPGGIPFLDDSSDDDSGIYIHINL